MPAARASELSFNLVNDNHLGHVSLHSFNHHSQACAISNAGVSNVAIACYLIRCAHTDESLVVLISQHTCNFPVRIGLDSTRRSHKQQGIATGDQVTDNFSTIRDISPNSASKPPDAPGSRSYCTHTMVSPVNPCLVILT